MLNISHNKVSKYLDLSKYESPSGIFNKHYHKWFMKLLLAFTLILLIILFLPWTQNIRAKGMVTTLKPGHRPQTIQSPIPGRIEEWFVQEGDFVKKGDTILRISEIKSEYFDDKLTERTGNQINAKSASVLAYRSKVAALETQINALRKERDLKLEQAKNKLVQAGLKVVSDSMDLQAAATKADIAATQYNRTVNLQKEGLKAVKEVEEYRNKLQEATAKHVSQQNKLMASRNERINAELQIAAIDAGYADKLAKAQSDRYTAQSSALDT